MQLTGQSVPEYNTVCHSDQHQTCDDHKELSDAAVVKQRLQIDQCPTCTCSYKSVLLLSIFVESQCTFRANKFRPTSHPSEDFEDYYSSIL